MPQLYLKVLVRQVLGREVHSEAEVLLFEEEGLLASHIHARRRNYLLHPKIFHINQTEAFSTGADQEWV